MRIVVCLVVLVALSAAAFAADTLVSVYVDGKLMKLEPAARVRGGVTYVPLRQGAEAMGLPIAWIKEKNSARICTDKGCVFIPKRDGIVVNGSIMLPLRRLGEVTGSKVTWDKARQAVLIEKPKATVPAHP